MKELGPAKKLVVMEAGNQLKWIALTLKKMKDVELHVVHPNELKWISQSSGKTDKIDARKMAELARGDLLPRKVHIVEGTVRELRELISARQQLQSKRVALINTIRGYMLQEGYKLPEKFFQRADWRVRLEKSRVSGVMKRIIVNLMSAIEGILALTPTVYQSGNVTQLGHINRDGRHEVRRVLLQCAHTVARMRSYSAQPLKKFFERVMKRRGKKIAIVALARKLITIAYGVLKSGGSYDPELLLPAASR